MKYTHHLALIQINQPYLKQNTNKTRGNVDHEYLGSALRMIIMWYDSLF